MGRLEKTTIAVIAVIVVILVAAFILQRSLVAEPSVRRVSVLVEDNSDQYWKAFRLGADQSSRIYNVDVHFIPTTDDIAESATKHDQQVANILREIETGTDAIILSPFDTQAMSDWLNTHYVDVPVIIIGAGITAANVAATIGSDDFEIGDRLGQEIESIYHNNPIVLFYTASTNHSNQVRYEALAAYLRSRNIPFDSSAEPVNSNDEVFQKVISTYTDAVFVAFYDKAVELLCANLAENDSNPVIIGVGYTNETLYALSNGVVSRLIVQSKFDYGYIGIEYAVKAIDGQWIDNNMLPLHVATKENMFTYPIQQILYPVVS